MPVPNFFVPATDPRKHGRPSTCIVLNQTMNALFISLTNPETVLPESRVDVPTPTLSNRMIVIIYGSLLFVGILSWAVSLANAWTAQDYAIVIGASVGAVSTLAAAVFAGWNAINNSKARARQEEMRLQGELRMQELQALRQEVKENTMVTHQSRRDVQNSVDQAKVRVEELTKVVEDNIPKS